MRINTEIKAEDFIDFQIHYLNTSEIIKKQIIKSRVTLSIVYVCIIFSFSLIFKDIAFYISTTFIIIFGILQIIGYRQTVKKRTIKNVKKMIAGDNAKSILGEKQYELTDGNLLIYKEESGETNCNINSLLTIEESDSSYFLYRDKISAYIIPKKLGNEISTDVQDFVNHIKERRLTTASTGSQDKPATS